MSAVGSPGQWVEFLKVILGGSFGDSLCYTHGKPSPCISEDAVFPRTSASTVSWPRSSTSMHSGVFKGSHSELQTKLGLKPRIHTVTRFFSGQGLGKRKEPGEMSEPLSLPGPQASRCRGVQRAAGLHGGCFSRLEHQRGSQTCRLRGWAGQSLPVAVS